MDKMPSATSLWATGAAVGASGFLLVRRWRWTLFPFLALAIALAWIRITIYSDSYVGVAVWEEGRWPYALVVTTSGLMALALPLLGLRGRTRIKRGKPAEPT